MRIVFYDPVPADDSPGTLLTLEELFRQSDFISLHIPLSQNTYHLIDAQLLSLIKPSAYLINTSRGTVVDQQALVRALTDEKLAGAALDVTDPEPLPPNHPLFGLSNCLILPHIGSATYKTRRRMAELACENLLAGLDGRPLPYCVNPEVYLLRKG
jgi:phosphoglycerate dehydrogenase-like enzyme